MTLFWTLWSCFIAFSYPEHSVYRQRICKKTLDGPLRRALDVNEALWKVQRELNKTVDSKVNGKVNAPLED
jgi:hypothetical protein